jgi:Putative metallopeptidase domain
MPRMLKVLVTGFAALVSAGRPAPSTEAAAPQVEEIADASLRDVAVAVYSPTHPVIYYNPDLLQRFSPELGIFFMAHERAHIALRHTRAGALRGQPGGQDRLLQAKELEADCLAASTLGARHRDASLAAVRFFTRMGDHRFDSEHPTGTERAARILDCMPE